MSDMTIHPGDRLMVTTATGDEVPAVADSRPEGPGRCAACSERLGYRQSHSFAVVWVDRDPTRWHTVTADPMAAGGRTEGEHR